MEGASERVRVRELGKSTEGNPFVLLEIASPETLKRLDYYRGLQRRLYPALNAAYELQIKGVGETAKESETVSKGLQALMKDLSDSKYREQISKLNENLTALNNVYGNMLAAMNVK